MTWVVADHLAAPGSKELSVTKGQQVEVLENGSTNIANVSTGEWTLVRLPLTPGQAEPPAEGLVPTSALKQPPTASCKTSPSRKASTQQQQQQQQHHHHQSHHHPYHHQQINQAIVQAQQQTAVTSSATVNALQPTSTVAISAAAPVTQTTSLTALSSAVLAPMLSEDAGE